MNELAVIVLAAGTGSRMNSDLPKVLHRAAGRSLLGHALHVARGLAPARTVIVSGPGMDDVAAESRRFAADAAIATQTERLGTGHAVAMAKAALEGFTGTALVLYGDVPLIETDTLKQLTALISEDLPMAVLGFEAADPHGYGRLLRSAPEREIGRAHV